MSHRGKELTFPGSDEKHVYHYVVLNATADESNVNRLMSKPCNEVYVVMELREANPDDATAIAVIYNYYVETSIISFEEEIVTAEDMAARIEAVQSLNLPWYVAVERNVTVGYAYASPWSRELLTDSRQK